MVDSDKYTSLLFSTPESFIVRVTGIPEFFIYFPFFGALAVAGYEPPDHGITSWLEYQLSYHVAKSLLIYRFQAKEVRPKNVFEIIA